MSDREDESVSCAKIMPLPTCTTDWNHTADPRKMYMFVPNEGCMAPLFENKQEHEAANALVELHSLTKTDYWHFCSSDAVLLSRSLQPKLFKLSVVTCFNHSKSYFSQFVYILDVGFNLMSFRVVFDAWPARNFWIYINSSIYTVHWPLCSKRNRFGSNLSLETQRC